VEIEKNAVSVQGNGPSCHQFATLASCNVTTCLYNCC